MSTSPKTIILWCHPRSCSTMFERAFLAREDFHVLHETMGDAWYFGPERSSKRFKPPKKEFETYREATYLRKWKEVTESGYQRVFSKDMSQYIIPHPESAETAPQFRASDGNPTFILTSQLLSPNVTHVFLIRTPEKAVPSYHKLCTGDACKVTGFEYFDPNETGLHESRVLFDFIKEYSKQTPLVVDAADLLKAPEEVMQSFCKFVDVDFQPCMLEWKAGKQEHFAKWQGWHVDAEHSTGIGKSPTRTPTNGHKEVPEIVAETIRANMADYIYLKTFTEDCR